MRILDTQLGKDIKQILGSYMGGSGSCLLDIVVRTKAGLKIEVERIHEHILTRDFSNVGDDIAFVIELKRSTYEYHLFPNRADLTAVVTITPCTPNGTNPGQPSIAEYSVRLDDPRDEGVVHTTFTGSNPGDKDASLMQCVLRLEDIRLTQLLPVKFSGVVGDTDLKTIIEVVCSNLGKYPIYVHEPDNKDIPPHISVPPGLAAIDLARWLQEVSVGLYNYGCGTYFLNGWVFVYPLFNLENVEDRPRHVVIKVAQDELQGVENTYAVKEGVVYIVSSGESVYIDNTEEAERIHGNSLRWNGHDMWGSVLKHDNGKHEFANHTLTLASRATRKTNLTTTVKGGTNNPYHMRSKLTGLNGKMMTLSWENANPLLIKPDTEIEIHYISGGELMSQSGIIVSYSQTATRARIGSNRDVFTPHGIITCSLR